MSDLFFTDNVQNLIKMMGVSFRGKLSALRKDLIGDFEHINARTAGKKSI